MANLLLRHIYKVYPGTGKAKKKAKGEAKKRSGDFVAVKDFSMEINDGEFIVFVGPSGCGKSTTLRMIAGLEEITSGELYIGDRLVNNVDAKDRDIAMVFQSYALYPHLTAYDNIAFGLKIRKIPTPRLDKEGKQVIDLDTNKIYELTKKVNKLKSDLNSFAYDIDKCKSGIDKTESLIETLSQEEKLLKEGEQTSGAQKKLTKVCKKLEQANYQKESFEKEIIFLNEQIELNQKRLEESQKELEYFKTTPVPLFNMVHMKKEEIDKKVKWAAEILGIEELLDSKPSEMSGGQRQRIALGRAMVRGPKVFLLDEPLSNLDAKLRTAMRSEIVKLHNQLKTTFIYVTHDQIEAMTMGTRIVVMKLGIVQQIDTPTNLFDYPDNKFVAGFIGTPQMNFFNVTIKKDGEKLNVTFKDGQSVSLNLKELRTIDKAYLDGEEHKVVLGARGENISLAENGIKTKLVIKEVLGNSTQLFVRLEEKGEDYIVTIPERNDLVSGDTVNIKFNEKFVHLFDMGTELSIMKREYGND
ncbi:MAG: ATP-binding cassette domain-containing protein [Clostridiales bacterium]|nr:ATP-binding cassette domain-containing protein [Clostridiales bacterium]